LVRPSTDEGTKYEKLELPWSGEVRTYVRVCVCVYEGVDLEEIRREIKLGEGGILSTRLRAEIIYAERLSTDVSADAIVPDVPACTHEYRT